MSTSLAPSPPVAPEPRALLPRQRSSRPPTAGPPAARERRITRWFERYVEMTPSSGTADAYLDGLRAVAVLAVVLLHSFGHAGAPHVPILGNLVDHLLSTGGWGVQLFFLLSGYLLSRSWFSAEAAGRATPAVGRFYVRRVARIVPAYYLSIALLVVLFVPAGLLSTSEVTGRQGLANIGLHLSFLHHVVPLSQRHFAAIGGVYWTLTIEFLFYLSLPLFVRCFQGRGAVRTPIACLGILLVWWWLTQSSLGWLVRGMEHSVAGAAAAGMDVPQGEPQVRFLLSQQFPTWLFAFSLGMTIARLVVRHRAGAQRVPWLRPELGPWLVAAGVVLLVVVCDRQAAMTTSGPAVLVFLSLAVMAPVSLSLVLLGLTIGPDGLRRPLETLPMRYLGWTSYGIYLFHVPVLVALNRFTGMAGDQGAGYFVRLFALTLLVSGLMASISWMFVERPSMFAAQAFLRRRTGTRVRRHRWRGVVVGALLLLVPGVVIGQAATLRGPGASYDGPLGHVRNAWMPPGLTGPITVAEAARRGYVGAEEQESLRRCGARRGASEVLGAPKWSATATVFACRGPQAAVRAGAAVAQGQRALGYHRLPPGEGSVLLHDRTEAAGPGDVSGSYVVNARFRSGARLVSITFTCRSREACRDASERVLGPARDRFPPSS